MGDFSIQQFEDADHENGMRYWYAHELMKPLGFASCSAFRRAITRAMAACADLGIDPTEAFAATTVTTRGQEVRTYKLTRFACFLVAMHADPKREEVARAIVAAVAAPLIEERAASLFRLTRAGGARKSA